jgi:hypothetical protein
MSEGRRIDCDYDAHENISVVRNDAHSPQQLTKSLLESWNNKFNDYNYIQTYPWDHLY